MMGDTPVKTVQNRQCIDNMSNYDSEHHRITKSVRQRIDLGPIMLPGAQQHTTVESAAALKIQDKIEGKYKAHMQSNNSQYRNEIYKRAENMIPQLQGPFSLHLVCNGFFYSFAIMPKVLISSLVVHKYICCDFGKCCKSVP